MVRIKDEMITSRFDVRRSNLNKIAKLISDDQQENYQMIIKIEIRGPRPSNSDMDDKISKG